MSEGQERPTGWAAEQPPPYGTSTPSPWVTPGQNQNQPPSPGGGAPAGSAPYGAPPPPPGPPYGPRGHSGGLGQGYAPPQRALRPGVIPLRPLTLGDILDGAIKLIRANPKVVLGLSALAALVTAIPVAVAQALTLGELSGALLDPTAGPDDLTDVSTGFISAYGSSIISAAAGYVIVTMLTGVLTRILGRAVFGGRLSAGEAWQLLKGRWPALFGVVLLITGLMLAPLLLLAPLFVLLVGNGADDTVFFGVALLFLLLYAGYSLTVTTRFAFATPAAVLEGLGPIAAMRRSWQLVSGDFWRVLGILLLTLIMAAFVNGVLTVPFTVIGTVIGILGGGGPASILLATAFIALGTMVAGMITYPVQAGVAGLLYTDRRMRAEAFDLVLQTAAIEQQRQGWVPGSADDLWHPSNAARR